MNAADRLAALLEHFDRVGITGAPKTGKTHLALAAVKDRYVFHTDTVKGFPWGEQPLQIIAALTGHARYVVEGVQVPRALRKGLALDALLVLRGAWEPQTKEQRAMGKGLETVMAGLESPPPIFYADRDAGP